MSPLDSSPDSVLVSIRLIRKITINLLMLCLIFEYVVIYIFDAKY